MGHKSLIADNQLHQEANAHKSELLSYMFGGIAAAVVAPTSNVPPKESNILGVGYGAKITGGSVYQDELAVRVYVRSKLPSKSLTNAEKIPSDILGKPTDVVAVGDISATAHHWPTPCGVSVGHFNITAGTLGCLVTKRGISTQEHYILSNNHVLADSNAGSIGPPGDNILQPGPYDGGVNPGDKIAELTEFKQIDFSGAANDIDAAIAKVLDINNVTPNILNIGNVNNPPKPAALYQSVRKNGRTTSHTIGVIMDLSANIWVRYGTNRAWFQNQLSIVGIASNPFSSGGDSGSLIVDAVTLAPIGLLFAGGGANTFANPIDPVLNHFAVDIL